MPGLLLRPTAHVELFDGSHGAAPRLIHSSRPDAFLNRPCRRCGARLGVTQPVVIDGPAHAHESCVRHG